MKVLFLYNNYKKFNYRIHKGFIVKLSKFCDFNIYGPGEHEDNPELAPMKYDEKITGKDLIGLFNPDIFLFNIHNSDCLSWYPKDICKVGIPSVLITQDHYTRIKELQAVDKENVVLDWCENSGLTLLIQRHFYEENQSSIQTVWFPHCVNEEEFYPDENVERKNIIGFAGSSNKGLYYAIRHRAREILKGSKLLDDDSGKLGAGKYPRYLRSHVGALACAGGILHTSLSRTFEIPLSGTAMMTNWMHESKTLFGDKQCFFTYKDDLSDVVNVANTILNDKDMVKEVTSNALEVVREKHTDHVRIMELADILLSLVEGKEVPRVWGG